MEIKSKRIYTITHLVGGTALAQAENLQTILNKGSQEIYTIIQREIFDEVISLKVGKTYVQHEVDGTYFITRIN